MTVATQETTAADILMADTPDLESLFYLDVLTCRQENWKEEIEALIPALSSKSDAEARIAAAWLAVGNFPKALGAADKIPNHPLGAMIQGLNQESLGHHEAALAHFQRAAQAAPTIAPFALKPIDSLRRLGRLEEAATMADNQRKQFSDKQELDFYICRVLEDSGRYQ